MVSVCKILPAPLQFFYIILPLSLIIQSLFPDWKQLDVRNCQLHLTDSRTVFWSRDNRVRSFSIRSLLESVADKIPAQSLTTRVLMVELLGDSKLQFHHLYNQFIVPTPLTVMDESYNIAKYLVQWHTQSTQQIANIISYLTN